MVASRMVETASGSVEIVFLEDRLDPGQQLKLFYSRGIRRQLRDVSEVAQALTESNCRCMTKID